MVVCALQPPDDLAAALQAQGAQVVCCNRRRPSILQGVPFATYVIKNLHDIVRLCKRERASVVHCHLSDAEFLGIAAGRYARVPRVVTSVHYPDLLPPRTRGSIRNALRRILTQFLYCNADTIIAVSEEVASRVRELAPGSSAKLRVIINGIDTAHYADLGAPAFGEHVVLTTVARLAPPKGHCFLLEAIRLLHLHGRHLKLLLAGEGDLRAELETQVNASGIGDLVVFLGNCSDIPALLGTTDIFVLPSLWEGTSLALLEAMAAGRPIVASDIPGIRTVLQHGSTGLLARPGDAPALAQAISVFLDNPSFARACGAQAKKTAQERFDISRTLAELYDVWGVQEM